MKPIRYRTATIILCVTLVIALLPRTPDLAARQDEAGNVAFRWGFGAIVGPAGGKWLAPITRDTVLKSGEELKMVLRLTKKCFVYVLYHDSRGELSLLFP